MVELIIVIVLIGALAAIGVPRLMSENDTPARVFGERVVSTLREAGKDAQARRRLVCLSSTATTLRVRIRSSASRASDAQGVAACDTSFSDIHDGDNDSQDPKVTQAGLPAVLYFQPDGSISASPAGAPLGQFDVNIRLRDAVQRTIVVDGRTGYAQ